MTLGDLIAAVDVARWLGAVGEAVWALAALLCDLWLRVGAGAA